jgi:hypothetical protein
MAAESKIIYSIIMTQVYDGEVLEPTQWVFDNKKQAWDFYQELVKDSDEDISKGRKTSDWVYDSMNSEDEKDGHAFWARYEDYSYPTDHIQITLDPLALNPSYIK